ncbi:uncharacterized protein LOC125524614 isoform X1 [Triticum urartu]|uniref:uncharacterized protein LOC125524614 isoform X1 n=1 Tax=Triticum urartu TaxID=4572 RepID=UPI002044B9C0|nr:uncharacterized protein LOC125524614 isoform X1 [Triticum urartu]
MMSDLAGVLKFGVNQRAHVWYSDRSKHESVCLNHESQLPAMFDMHLLERFIELVVKVSNILAQNGQTIQNESAQNDPSAVAQDISQDNLTQPNSETEYTDDIDPFDLPEEYVGVDDEHIYDFEPKIVNVPVVQMLDDDEPAVDGHIREVAIDDDDDDDDPSELIITHNPQDPVIEEKALFPDMVTFRKAIRHYAIKKDFEFGNLRTDKTRFIANCSHESCRWRIHASRLQDGCKIMIKKLPYGHTCPTTELLEGRMASQGWVADRLGDWLKKNPAAGAKEAQKHLQGDYKIRLKYSKAWAGITLASEQLHGKYDDSFQILFNWKSEIEKRSPGSIVEIELQETDNEMCFKRVFVALKPCIDGFLAGCRPYIGVDSTALNGKYKGQLGGNRCRWAQLAFSCCLCCF